MQEKIRKHIDSLFIAAPKTRKALELKEEMTQNTIDKYEDLIIDGYPEEDAFQNVIHSIGDVSELFSDLEEPNILSLSESDRQKKAMLTSIAVGLYILAGLCFFTGVFLEDSFMFSMRTHIDFTVLGLIIAGFVCIPPTCLLIYAANMYPSFHKKEDSLVEDYKENRYVSNKTKAVKNSVRVIIWTLVVALYFLISFTTMCWYMTWVIFLIGGCIQAIVELIFSLRRQD